MDSLRVDSRPERGSNFDPYRLALQAFVAVRLALPEPEDSRPWRPSTQIPDIEKAAAGSYYILYCMTDHYLLCIMSGDVIRGNVM